MVNDGKKGSRPFLRLCVASGFLSAMLAIFGCDASMYSASAFADSLFGVIDPRTDFTYNVKGSAIAGVAAFHDNASGDSMFIITRNGVTQTDNDGTVICEYLPSGVFLETNGGGSLWRAFLIDTINKVTLLYNHGTGQRLYLFPSGSSGRIMKTSGIDSNSTNGDYFFSVGSLSPYESVRDTTYKIVRQASPYIVYDMSGTQAGTFQPTGSTTLAACMDQQRSALYVLSKNTETAPVDGTVTRTYYLEAFSVASALILGTVNPNPGSINVTTPSMPATSIEKAITLDGQILTISYDYTLSDSTTDSTSTSYFELAFNTATSEFLGHVENPEGSSASSPIRAYTYPTYSESNSHIITAIRWSL